MSTQPAVDHTAIVVGAGFGGMGMAIQLQRSGIDDVLILDRNTDLGGTWHANTYPGVAVDIMSLTYSFSFLPEPNWSRLHAPGNEIQAYAGRVADQFDLRRRMRFGVTVTDTRWDDAHGRWVVTTGDEVLTCRYLVLATGFLSQPKTPSIAGLDRFAGPTVHTAAWDHDLDLAGKRVGVIGTGATSVQLLPEIAPVAEHLTVFQRTPIWVTAKPDLGIPMPLRRVFGAFPPLQWAGRQLSNVAYELLATGVLFHRQAPGMTEGAQRIAEKHLARQVKDPELRAKLTPTYGFGCKRPTFSNTYYPTLVRDDVSLVTEGITVVEADGVRTADGTLHALDVLVLATGFHLMDEGNFPPFPVTGRDGVELGRHWRDTHFQSYEGITVAGCPNLLMLSSPYAYSGLSAFFTIESQMLHVKRLLAAAARLGSVRDGEVQFEPTAAAQDRFVAAMRAKMVDTVFVAPTCAASNSYYVNEHGEATLARLRNTPQAFVRARTFPLADYVLRPAPATSPSAQPSLATAH